MQRHDLTLDEKKTLNWFVTKAVWLKQRYEDGDAEARRQMEEAQRIKSRLERSIKDRIGVHWLRPVTFDHESVLVE